MSERIPLIPEMPNGLREASQRGILIPFIGAGASRIAGCPGWAEFADGALRYFVNAGKFGHGELAQTNHLNPRVKLSIALALEKEFGTRINFRDLLHPSGRNNPKGQQLFRCVSKLGTTFVTTNYDEWLDDEIPVSPLPMESDPNPAAPVITSQRKVIHKVQDMTAESLSQPNTVIHLHGSLLDPAGMILTTQRYMHHYANDRFSGMLRKENRVLTFLEYLFKNKNVLFIGYGLEELEILEYVILKARATSGSGKPETKHYLLHGFFSHEYELMRHVKRYYLEECGIELIPFLRDKRDWDQLLDVLEEFSRVAPASQAKFLQDFKEMGDLLNG
jgi:hypothetical protein